MDGAAHQVELKDHGLNVIRDPGLYCCSVRAELAEQHAEVRLELMQDIFCGVFVSGASSYSSDDSCGHLLQDSVQVRGRIDVG